MTGTPQDAIFLRLNELRHRIPTMLKEHGEDGFWSAYAEIADAILEDAGRISDEAWHDAFLFQNSMLSEAGLITGEQIET